MPRKKVGSDSNTTEETPQKQTIEDILIEGEELKAKEEEKAVLEAKEKENEEEVEVDLDELAQKTQEETLSKVEEKLNPILEKLDSLTEKKEEIQEKSEVRKELEALQEKAKLEGRELTYDEALEFVTNKSTELALKRIEETNKQREEEQKQQEEQIKKQQEEQNEKNFQVWQSQLSEMETNGLIPKMENAKEGDPGFDARISLYAKMQESWNTQNPLTNMYEVLAKNPYQKQSNQPAGADAPVMMGQGSGEAATGEGETKYEDIRNIGRDIEGFLYKLRNRG